MAPKKAKRPASPKKPIKKNAKSKKPLAALKKDSEVVDAQIVDPEIIDLKAQAEKAEEKSLSNLDPITKYLAEIRKYPLLTREQEHEAAVRLYEKKDPIAAELLVTSNLRFVVKIAAEYSRFGSKLIDLIQEGNVGLMHAVREFNPYKGVRLITYAVWWIRGYIQEYLMKQYSMVRIGTTQSQRKLFYQLQKHKAELESLGQEATKALMSSRLDVKPEEVEAMQQRLGFRDISLDQPMDEDGKSFALDLQTDASAVDVDDQLSHSEQLEILKKHVEAVRPELSQREVEILEKRLLADEPATLQEIADHYGVTREAIRQMESKVLGLIRKRFLAEERS